MKFKTVLGSFLVLCLMIGSAWALPFNTTGGLSFNNTLHDTSAEYLINNGEQNTTVDVGDWLAGDLIIHKINNDDIGNAIWPELTAKFVVEVETKTANANGGWDYTFTSTLQTGEMAWFYVDASNDASFTDPTTFGNGNLWASFGLTDSDTQWTAWTATDDILALAAILNNNPSANPFTVGYFDFLLDVINNNSSLTFLDVGTTNTQLTGTGHFQAKDATGYSDTYHIGDQANMNINVVPEPATLSLLGLGLLGLAGIARRRN